jgi:hypothetical protein
LVALYKNKGKRHKQEDHDQLRSPFPKGKLLEIDNQTVSIIEERHAHQLKYMQAKYKDIQSFLAIDTFSVQEKEQQ